jgi:serine/threonine protein kinase
MALSAGRHLGPYEVLAPIGAGGMGEVYRARDTRLGRDVAVKVLPGHVTKDPEARARFEREARTAAGLSDPHVCALFDFGTEGDVHYAVFDLLEGETLRPHLSRGPLSPARAVDLATQMCEGLAAAHAKGIVHRDLKPENLFLTRSGLKILDFGLAKVRPASGGGGRSTRRAVEGSNSLRSGAADGPGGGAGDGGLHVARAGTRGVRGRAVGHLRDGCGALRDALGGAALPAGDPGRDADRDPPRRPPGT